jgi:RNA polymerase sigma-70 factor (ECF subfamily)
MLAFQGGDDSAFDRLVTLCKRRIFALGYRYGLDAQASDDLVQETMLRVYRARARYRPEARFNAWLMRIAKNLLISRARKVKRRRTIQLSARGREDEPESEIADPRGGDPRARIDEHERARQVREALDDLPESQRTALLLNRFEEMSYEEGGEALGLKVPAVKSLRFRARQSLKSRLERYMRDPG